MHAAGGGGGGGVGWGCGGVCLVHATYVYVACGDPAVVHALVIVSAYIIYVLATTVTSLTCYDIHVHII